MYTDISAARMMVMKAAWDKDQGNNYPCCARQNANRRIDCEQDTKSRCNTPAAPRKYGVCSSTNLAVVAMQLRCVARARSLCREAAECCGVEARVCLLLS